MGAILESTPFFLDTGMKRPAIISVGEVLWDLFPEGESRELVLNNCSSCHAVACAVIGQRTAARWNGLKEGHSDRMPGLADGELDRMFAYLQGHFNDTQPEPSVPAAFLEAGCTPF